MWQSYGETKGNSRYTWWHLFLFQKPVARAVLTNGHTGHVSRASGFFLFEGPQLAVVK